MEEISANKGERGNIACVKKGVDERGKTEKLSLRKLGDREFS